MSLDTSAWILAAISVERFIAVCMPQKHKLLTTTSRAWKIVLAIVIFQILFNANVFITYGPETINGDNTTRKFECGFSSNSSREYLTKYHVWIAMAIYGIIPFTVMLTLNVFIISRLSKIKKAFASYSTSSTTSRSKINTHSMTRMLLCVTFYFVIITMPVFIFEVFQQRIFSSKTKEITPEKKGQIEIVDAVLTLMLYLNHSINFFLYCVSGRRFKKELLKLLRCRKKSETTQPTGGMGSLTCSPSKVNQPCTVDKTKFLEMDSMAA